MRRKLPPDEELTPKLMVMSNAAIARMYGGSASAVSGHRQRLGVPFLMVEKVCCRCSLGAPAVRFHKDSSAKDGLSRYCTKCQVDKNREYRGRHRQKSRDYGKWKYENNRESVLKKAKGNYLTNKVRYWRNNLKRKYGVDAAWYERQLAEQQGACAICLQNESRTARGRLSVDHDHSTGAVRGLLCASCNSLLGHAKDRLDLLENAKMYLVASSRRSPSSS